MIGTRSAPCLALALVACGSATPSPRDRAPDVALSYAVSIDSALTAMRVTVCPRGAPLPEALVPTHAEGADHLRAAALVVDGRPVAGVIEAPALGETFAATLNGGATRNGKATRASARTIMAGGRIAGPPQQGARVAKELGMVLEPNIPSLAVRFAHVACATIDAGVASPNAHDWDIAAADLILHESGALLADLDGRAPLYNRQETRHGTLVAAPLALHAELTQALARLRPVEEATGPHAKANQT